MRRMVGLLVAGACAGLAAQPAAQPAGQPAGRPAGQPGMAVFSFTLVNTSPAASTPEEIARLHRLDGQLNADLRQRFALVDIAPVQARMAEVQSIQNCNGCEIDAARQMGAGLVAYGWVQKVSNLILNVNLVIEDVATGRTLHADSVDIRGNTDESWSRGLRFLLNERIFRE